MSVRRFDAAFSPQWAGGWAVSRWIFVVAQAGELLRQAAQVLDSYRHPGFNFGSGILHLSNTPLYGVPAAWGVWTAAALGLGALAFGGRLAKPGLLLWMIAELALFSGLGWESNAPERIMGWTAVGLLLGPIGERGLTTKWRSPVGRWFFLVWVSGMYGMAGAMKGALEPGWWDGTILAQAIADPIMGGTPWGLALVHHPWIPQVLGWFTLLFETGFVVGVNVRRSNPWTLLVGLAFHLGIAALMSVGTLGVTVLASYPILLDPEVAERVWGRVRGR